MCQNVHVNPPLSSVYRAGVNIPNTLVWDLSDGRVKPKHLENAIPMAILYWTRDLERSINDLHILEIRVPERLEGEAYRLFLQKKLVNPELLAINVVFAGGEQVAADRVFPQRWHDLITAPSPTITAIHQIMAAANLPILESLLFYQNVTNKEHGIVQGRIFGLKVLTINIHQQTVTVAVGDDDAGLGLQINNWKNTEGMTDAQLLHAIARERANPVNATLSLYSEQEEHYLESKVLSLISAGGNLPAPWQFIMGNNVFFQFPVITTHAGHSKFIDILARDGNAPVVIEIKVATNSTNEGEYYFQAIGQAMSYAGFLKGALPNQTIGGTEIQFNNVRPAVLFPQFSVPHNYLRVYFANLITALNSKLNTNNTLSHYTVNRDAWQQNRTVTF